MTSTVFTDFQTPILASWLNDVNTATYSGSAIYTPAGTGAVATTVQTKLRESVSVKDFGAVGDGVTDDTAAIQAAFTASDMVRAPAGTWNVTSISIPAGKTLVTDGQKTIIQQIAGQAVGTRVIKVTGSNVTIGDLWIKGNISTDTDEQQHGIFIQANATNGNLENIHIGNIKGTNVRGDVIYAGQTAGYTLKNVSVGDVVVDNVYRNGVSIVSGDNISVSSVTGSTIGFCHLDIEPNAGSGTATNIRIGSIKGRTFGVVPPTSADYADAIEIGTLDLSPANASQSTPSYAAGAAIEDGLLLRNVKRLKIGHFKAVGFNRCAIFTTYNAGELGAESIEIDSVYLRTCSLTDVTYNSYIQMISLASNKLIIGYLDGVITQTAKRVIDGMRSGSIGQAQLDIQASSSFLRNCNDVNVDQVVQTGANGFLLQTCNRVRIGGGSFTGDRLATASDKCTFENFTATAAVFLFSSGQEDHTIINSTLNGGFYSFGTAIQSYLNCMRFGAYYLWVSSTGKLYIKSSAPTTDTDGTVVGTQV